jgi:hypothetical protein
VSEQDERELLIDLVTAALMALETGRRASDHLVALRRVLQDKGFITLEEIDAVERAHEVTRLLSENPGVGAFAEQWGALQDRLKEAQRRLKAKQ